MIIKDKKVKVRFDDAVVINHDALMLKVEIAHCLISEYRLCEFSIAQFIKNDLATICNIDGFTLEDIIDRLGVAEIDLDSAEIRFPSQLFDDKHYITVGFDGQFMDLEHLKYVEIGE